MCVCVLYTNNINLIRFCLVLQRAACVSVCVCVLCMYTRVLCSVCVAPSIWDECLCVQCASVFCVCVLGVECTFFTTHMSFRSAHVDMARTRPRRWTPFTMYIGSYC